MCIAEFDYSVKIDAQKELKERAKYPPHKWLCISELCAERKCGGW